MDGGERASEKEKQEMRSEGSWESIDYEGAGAERHGHAGYCVEIGRSGEDGHRETCEEALAITQAKHNAKI